MVLQHVTGRTGAVVEAGAGADAHVLGHRDLDRVDEVAVPHRLEQRVGEPQREQVLDRLLAQVVVDAEDVLRREHLVDQRVELVAARQVVAERLLDDDPPPAAALGVVGHPGALHLLEHDGEHRRRDRQVERGVALDAVRLLHLDQRRRRACRRPSSSSNDPGMKRMLSESRCQTSSRNPVRAPFSAASRDSALEVAVAPVAAGEAEQREARRQQAAVGQVVDRRDQLLAGQVAGDAEHDERARPGHPRAAAGPGRRAAGSAGLRPASWSGMSRRGG